MKKKTERQKVKDKLDSEFSLFIRRRDNFTCVTCGLKGSEGDGVMQAGHLFSRSNMAGRYSETNTNCQCRGCNMRHEYDFEPYRKWFVHKHGQNVYDWLYLLWNRTTKMGIGELKSLLEYYHEKNKEKK